MTREEALKILNDCRRRGFERNTYTVEEYHTARDMAIEALEQESCDDVVSRDMMLEKMADYVASGYADSVKDFEEYSRIICQLSSVKPQEPKWISVSERLPEKHGRYLAYIVSKYDTDYQYIMTCEYFESDLWCWFPDDECVSDNVVAWMPLPKPYNAESEDKNEDKV